MTKLVILKLSGDFESGFQISLEIGLEGKSADCGFSGFLPPATELRRCLAQLQDLYRQQSQNCRIKPQQIIYDGSINPHKQLVKSAAKLHQELQNWLNYPSFNSVDKHLREELNRQEVIRMLICSNCLEIYQLPWCCWDLVDNYPKLEIAISNFNFERVPTIHKPFKTGKVKILAILGDGRGLNLEADRAFLNSLAEGEVIFLIEPTRQELYAHLWQDSWDIIFFAGHSQTIARQGLLSLNAEDQLTIEELRPGFKQAIASGLQLAIFNSCDGLGIAEELGQLSLPQSIVMRWPIPDIMAQQFVKYLLQAYAGGNSLYISTRMAREQLQGWEKQFPCAAWLPIIYQNPAIIPPKWADLRGNQQKNTSKAQLRWQPQLLASISIISAVATMLVWLMQTGSWLQAGELNAYDRFIGWRTTPPADERILIITIDDQDIQYQREQNLATNMRGSLSDEALAQLITRLQPGQPKAIASDIIHDFPFSPKLADIIAQTDDFFAICRVKIDQAQLVSIAPPSQLPPEQVGFSNWAVDDDKTIRRQILGMSPDQVCQSGFSFGLRLALKYLDHPPAKLNQQGLLQIGETVFPKLSASSGGYHLPEAQGYQVLLNYRHTSPQTIALREIFTIPEQSLAKLVQDKIVFLGVVGHNHDLHLTPLSKGKHTESLPGVVIHAQMTSQIISAVLGEQKLLWWFSDKVELIWVALWSAVGSIIIILLRRSIIKIAVSIYLALTVLLGCCWLLFLNGGWIIAIAPAWGLLISAALTAVYRRTQSVDIPHA
ncbi:CHASE2 domain-containing protein [Pleurocapsa sp. PCC 7319]|uniref:CHASE2 domain-containing protein n=1 Tax=Pleurocapsa sp. PCC 7319 TaxID=118161 RepID=UPI00034B624A|nr:CHASE2 domain-containing protein [Pleurocapsa sp. PCC 7319]